MRESSLLWLWLALWFCCGVANRAAYGEALTFPEKEITLIGNANLKINIDFAANSKTISDMCAKIAPYMTERKGVFGFGAFKETSCYKQNNRLSDPIGKEQFSLNIAIKKNSLALHFFIHQENKSILLAKKRWLKVKSPELIVTEKTFLELYSLWLFDHTPLAMHIDAKRISRSLLTLTSEGTPFAELEAEEKPTFPEKLAIFSLGFNHQQQAFEPRQLGTAVTLTHRKNQQKALHQKVEVGNEKAKWDIRIEKDREKEFYDMLMAGNLWAQNIEGIKTQDKLLSQLLKEEVTKLSDDFGSGLASNVVKSVGSLFSQGIGYIGFRYGTPLLTDPTNQAIFVNDMRFYGLIAEIRNGIADGLYLFVDVWPKIHQTSPGGNSISFGGNRAIIGKRISFNINRGISRLYVTPAIGRWNFGTTVPISDAEGNEAGVETFSSENALSLGVTAGADILSRNYIVDFWFAKDTSIPQVNTPDAATVSTTRIGIDSQIGLPRISALPRRMVFSLVLFAFGESTSLIKKVPVTVGEEDNQQTIEQDFGIDFGQIYGGTGATISW